ncbi:MAG: ABC transporter substrate-binding protein [Chloroflexi bacterium]|nr:ABC transporter substrate-binding protein [Chloroflexota bacterium]
MTKTRTSFVVSWLAFLGFLVAACAPAAPPTPTTKPAVPSSKAVTTATGTAAPTAASPVAKPATTPKPAAQTSNYGGTVTRVTYRDTPSFDLQRELGADASIALFNIYQGLVRAHPIEHQKIVPELAEKWEISPDGMVYTFTFPTGIKWHDGQSFTMDDVKYSLERMQKPKAFNTLSPRGEGLLAAMDNAQIAGENSIKIALKYPSASFLPNIATGWIAIEPKHILVAKGDTRRDAVGTGAFKLKQFSPDISLELVKNPNYHIKGLPYLDGIKYYTVKDDATRFSVFRTGQVKITFTGSAGLTSTQTEIVRRDMAEKATVYESDAITSYVITFNMGRKPWDDVRVRKAVDLAFDHQAAIKVNGNRGYIGSIYTAPWGMKPEELAKLPGFRQPKDADIAEAKKLMAEAGYPNGFKTTLICNAGAAREKQAVFAKDQLAKIGIDAEITPVDQTTLYERGDRRAFDLLTTTYARNTTDPDETLYTFYATRGSRNYGDFSDKAVDELIGKQARTLDEGARKEILAEIEKKITSQVASVIPFWDIWQTGAWNEVKNYRPGPGIHPWGKLDHVWLAR